MSADALAFVVFEPFACEGEAVLRQCRGALRTYDVGQRGGYIKREGIDAEAWLLLRQIGPRTGSRRGGSHNGRVNRPLALLRFTLLLDLLVLFGVRSRGSSLVSRRGRQLGVHPERDQGCERQSRQLGLYFHFLFNP
ncbi:protein of unknown function [Paraburkholderia kururiensis]